MMFIPRVRTKPQKSVYRERSVPAFRRWIKKLQCSVKGCQNVDIDPAHVRVDLPSTAPKGGAALKPHDSFCVPLCRDHHNEQHQHGERTFWAKYKADPVALSESLWATWLKTTQPGQKWAREHG